MMVGQGESTTVSYGGENFKEFPVERFTKPKTFTDKLSSFCVNTVLTVISICVMAAAIAGTCKFIMWLF